MVVQITKYKCEICKFEYSLFDQALKCELNGYEKPLSSVGDLAEYRLHLDDGGYISLDVRISEIDIDSHYVVYKFEEEVDDGVWQETMYDAYGNEEFKTCVILKEAS